jgi:hypothetical protein
MAVRFIGGGSPSTRLKNTSLRRVPHELKFVNKFVFLKYLFKGIIFINFWLETFDN